MGDSELREAADTNKPLLSGSTATAEDLSPAPAPAPVPPAPPAPTNATPSSRDRSPEVSSQTLGLASNVTLTWDSTVKTDSDSFALASSVQLNQRMSDVVDRLHRIFFWVAVPLAVLCGLLGIILYATGEVTAITICHVVSGYAAFSAAGLTIFLIFLHTTVYTNPTRQRLICRILLMVPIYAFDSWLALLPVTYKSATLIGLLRDTYEGYVIYVFFCLLMDYLHGEENTVRLWEKDQPTMKHLFPFTYCLAPVQLNARTLRVWKICLLQYVVLNPLLTLISVPLYYTGHYHEGVFSSTNGYLYIAAMRFVSVTFSFTSLVYFFFGVKVFILEHKPLSKFAAIKAIVFLTFWQSVIIGALHHFGVIPHGDIWTSEQVSTGLNNFVICVEMFLISIAHRWCFPDAPYRPPEGRRKIKAWVICHLFSIRDVVDEAQVVLVSPVVNTVKDVARYGGLSQSQSGVSLNTIGTADNSTPSTGTVNSESSSLLVPNKQAST